VLLAAGSRRVERKESGWIISGCVAMKDAVRGQRDGKERASSRMFILKPYFRLLAAMKRKMSYSMSQE